MTSTSPIRGRKPADIERATADAVATVLRNISRFEGRYPDDTTAGGRYPIRPAGDGIGAGGNRGWTTSFWPGTQWIAWEVTGLDDYREAALGHAADFGRRLRAGDDVDTHDLGFLYSLACVAAWRLTGDADARDAALDAADKLMGRFLESAGIIQAWGDLSDPAQSGRTIIDSLMNLPLLTWAAEQTGERRFADAVYRHTSQLREHILRPDGSTFHTFYWDTETGAPLRGATEQGAHDDSCWSRGQAWGIYGFALSHRATGDPGFLEASRRCADYFLSHLPPDHVPYWDLVYGEGSAAPRDSSAAAIAACGLVELARAAPEHPRSREFLGAADAILDSLIANYTPQPAGSSDALILHGVYDLPKDIGVDEGTLWGDYFYLEALMRRARPDWRSYW